MDVMDVHLLSPMGGGCHAAWQVLLMKQFDGSLASLTRTIVVVRSQDSRPGISHIMIATCFFSLQTSEMIAPVEQIGQAVLVVSALEGPG
jgi:hypothetical protein